jgi:hypothetical protein
MGTGSGGVKMMGGVDEVVGSTTTFEVSKEVPTFPIETEAPPKFKAAEDKPPKFKAAEDKPPKSKTVDKKKPEFKIARK